MQAETIKLNHGYILMEYPKTETHRTTKKIYKPRPYDNANYWYAAYYADLGVWHIQNDNQLGSRRCEQESPNDIADWLNIANSNIKPRMIHN